MKLKGKQILISDTVFEEIQKMAEGYDLDKRSIMNAAVIRRGTYSFSFQRKKTMLLKVNKIVYCFNR